jgi:prepilin-type N-terminal cleavage/methylation domain-containing protein
MLSRHSERGFSLIETIIALGVLTVGLLGAAGVMAQGLQRVSSSPGDLIATQKASEAIESVFSARDSHVLTWAQIRNVHGAAEDGGIFIDQAQQIRLAGPDGLVGTADDSTQPIESVQYPGPDQILNTLDDQKFTLNGYTREIKIRDVETDLRSITVIITYKNGASTRSYTLTTYISNFS